MIKFISHRGNDTGVNYPENSKEAILEVLKRDYISGVEFDVRMTRDKRIVVVHDNTIALSGNGSSLISKTRIKQLEKYNFGTIANPFKIATLEDVLSSIDCNKEIIIEIKEEENRYKRVVNVIYNIIKNYHNLNIKICSFNYDLVKYFKKKHPDIKIGLLIGIKMNLNKEDKSFDFYSISVVNYKKYLDCDNIYVWTINEKGVCCDIDKVIKKDFSVISDVCKNLL